MNNYSILVIEDEVLVGRYIKQVLEKADYEVQDIYTSSKGVLKKIKDDKPDVIIMDIMIQGNIDGIELSELIQEEYNIPVIYLTAYTDEKTINRAKLTSPFAYLVKPFNEQELIIAVDFAIYENKNLIKYKSTQKKPTNERKDEIVKAGLEIISTQNNPKMFTIKNIAKKIGITEGAIYKHFKSKNDIISIMVDYLTDSFNILFNEINMNSISNFKGTIRKIVELWIENYYSKEKHINILFSNGYDRYGEELEQCIKNIRLENKKILINLISKYQNQVPQNNNVEADYIADMLISSVKNILHDNSYKKEETRNKIDKILDNLYKILKV